MVDEFITEEEQVERIKQWWSENGRFVIVGVVLGIAIIGGFRYWQDYRIRIAGEASDAMEALYEDLDAGNFEEVKAAARTIEDKYASTPYDDHALLALAKAHVDNDDIAGAQVSLQKVLDTTRDRQLKHIARTRLARLMIHDGKANEALMVLDQANGKTLGGFKSRYAEIRGDAYKALGDANKAKNHYQLALDQFQLGTGDRRVIEMKLANVDQSAQASANEVTEGEDTPPSAEPKPLVDSEPAA